MHFNLHQDLDPSIRPTRLLYGNSLRHCVQSIAAGEVDMLEVGMIFSNVSWKNEEQYFAGMIRYAEECWTHPGTAFTIALAMFRNGTVINTIGQYGVQPGKIDRDHRVGNLRNCWVDDLNKLVFFNKDGEPIDFDATRCL